MGLVGCSFTTGETNANCEIPCSPRRRARDGGRAICDAGVVANCPTAQTPILGQVGGREKSCRSAGRVAVVGVEDIATLAQPQVTAAEIPLAAEVSGRTWLR